MNSIPLGNRPAWSIRLVGVMLYASLCAIALLSWDAVLPCSLLGWLFLRRWHPFLQFHTLRQINTAFGLTLVVWGLRALHSNHPQTMVFWENILQWGFVAFTLIWMKQAWTNAAFKKHWGGSWIK